MAEPSDQHRVLDAQRNQHRDYPWWHDKICTMALRWTLGKTQPAPQVLYELHHEHAYLEVHEGQHRRWRWRWRCSIDISVTMRMSRIRRERRAMLCKGMSRLWRRGEGLVSCNSYVLAYRSLSSGVGWGHLRFGICSMR